MVNDTRKRMTWLAPAMLAATALVACDGSAVLKSSSTLGQARLLADSKAGTALDFGPVDCGGEAPKPKTVTLTNDGEGSLRWAASLDSIAYFTIDGATEGTLEAGQSVTITVKAAAMPTLAAAGDLQRANLVVTTDDQAHPAMYVPLSATAQGATLELVAPSAVDFGQTPMGTPANGVPVTIKNTGNAPVKVSVADPNDKQFSFTWDGGTDAVEVAPGKTLAGLAAQFTAATATVSNSAAIVTATGAVCGSSVKSFPVRGQGLGGVVGISPGTLDLGKVGCDTQAGDQQLTIYNTGNLVFTWSATLKDGSNYKLSQSGGAVPANGIAQITLTPKKMPMTTNQKDNAFGDVLTITTDIAGDMPHDVPILQTAAGAILNWTTAAPLDFGSNPIGVAAAPKVLTLVNDGNMAAKVTVGEGTPFPGTSGTVPAMGNFVTAIKYTADNLGTQTGKIEVKTDDPVCQALPKGIAASGSGKGTASAISLGGAPRNRGNYQGGCVILDKTGGKVACFGTNEYGQLGTKTGTSGPFVVPDLKDIVSIASGGDYNCAVDKNGAVYCWGNNRARNNQQTGKLGFASEFTEVPTPVNGVSNAVKVAIGHNLTCALTGDGNVYCWGTNRRGNLGTGNQAGINNPAPQQVSNLSNAVDLALGAGGGCARKNDNTVWCWGREALGNLGNCCGPQAMQVQNMNDALALSASTNIARSGTRCAVRQTGQVYCWGNAARGALGGGLDCRRCTFQNPFNAQVNGTAVAVAGYYTGACALMNDKSIQCWGKNDQGQVGDGTTFQHNNPTPVAGINDATALAAGGMGACAIVTGGSVKCWGNYGLSTSSTPQTLKYF